MRLEALVTLVEHLLLRGLLWCLLLSQFQLGRVRVQAEASCSLSATFFSMLLFHFTPDFLECIGVVRRRVRVLGLVRVRVFEN